MQQDFPPTLMIDCYATHIRTHRRHQTHNTHLRIAVPYALQTSGVYWHKIATLVTHREAFPSGVLSATATLCLRFLLILALLWKTFNRFSALGKRSKLLNTHVIELHRRDQICCQFDVLLNLMQLILDVCLGEVYSACGSTDCSAV